MQITHLGHAAVLVEVADRRILIDPGNFSDEWRGLTDLDAILVTHIHGDHVDPDYAPALVENNPDALVYVEPNVLEAVPLPRAKGLAADSSFELGGVRVSAVGGVHAIIHRDLPTFGNVGLVITAEGEPTLFHPGDALDTVPAGVDVLAAPLYGPWAAAKETVDFVRAVGATHGFGIHDRLLAERGVQLLHGRLEAMTSTTMHDLRDGKAWTPA